MKKIYFILFGFISLNIFSQTNLTLTRAMQEPVLGDVYATQDYDSIGVVPKNTGANQVWNFSAVTQNTTTALSSYVSTVAVPASSTFAGATLAEDQGAGNYNIWKSATTPTNQWELLGSINTSTTPANGVKFTNSAISAIWPMAPGDTYTDSFSGNIFGIPLGGTGSAIGTQTVSSSGSGTITLPNGLSYSGVVQVKLTQTYSTSISVFTINLKAKDTVTTYIYFHPSQKFQLLQVQYQSTFNGTTTTKSFAMSVNKNVSVGLKAEGFSQAYSFYPNPSKNKINFDLNNVNNENCSIAIYNLIGEEVLNLNLGNASKINEAIDISRLQKGTYIFKTKLGIKSEAKRLLVE